MLDVEHEGLFPTFKGEPEGPEQADVAEEDYDSQDDLASPDEEVDSETPLDDAATGQAVESGVQPGKTDGRDGAFARRVLAGLIATDVFVRMPFVAPQDRCIRVSCGPDAALERFALALPDALSAAG